MDLTHAYHDINKPLLHYKRKVWYDDSKGINKLDELAEILGLKSLTICGEKDDESDIAIIRTNNAGNGLILENCHLELEIKEVYESMLFKDNEGHKTSFRRGEKNVI